RLRDRGGGGAARVGGQLGHRAQRHGRLDHHHPGIGCGRRDLLLAGDPRWVTLKRSLAEGGSVRWSKNRAAWARGVAPRQRAAKLAFCQFLSRRFKLMRPLSRTMCRLTILAAATALTPPAFAAAPAAKSVPIPSLVSQVTIPHSMFKLANGLTVIVHEDHKAPVTAVSVWYNVGSKDEPAHKDGFAHLFEHLMFNGTENLPGDYFTYLQNIGATDYNGTTAHDR